MSDLGLSSLSAFGQVDQSSNKDKNAANNKMGVQFENVLQDAIKDAIKTGQISDQKIATGLSGGGNMSDIATSVEAAKLSLQTVTAIKDRAVQSYQDIMKMTI